MVPFAHDLRQLLHSRIDNAPVSEMLGLALGICSAEAANQPIRTPTKAPLPVDRFIKLSADGGPLLADAKDWVAVYDAQNRLTWTRQILPGEFAWSDALAAAAKVDLFGHNDWRAPTIQEQLSIIDYEHIEPALDTQYFDGKFGWCWTSTPAKAPAGYAWFVSLDDGGSSRARQGSKLFVRAVRAGQLFDL